MSVVLCRYFFIKLRMSQELDLYNVMKTVHNWLPLLVIMALILSKVAIIYRSYLVTISQVRLPSPPFLPYMVRPI